MGGGVAGSSEQLGPLARNPGLTEEAQDGLVWRLVELWSLPHLPWPLASRLVVVRKARYHPTRRSLPLLEFWATAPRIKADIEP